MTDFAHRVGAAQGGPVSVVNGLGLCRPCHRWCHDNPDAAVTAGLMLRGWQDPAAEPVWLRPVNGWSPDFGWWLLDPEGVYQAWDGDRPPPVAYPHPGGLV